MSNCQFSELLALVMDRDRLNLNMMYSQISQRATYMLLIHSMLESHGYLTGDRDQIEQISCSFFHGA